MTDIQSVNTLTQHISYFVLFKKISPSQHKSLVFFNLLFLFLFLFFCINGLRGTTKNFPKKVFQQVKGKNPEQSTTYFPSPHRGKE